MKSGCVIIITILLLCMILQTISKADEKLESTINITSEKYEKGYRYNIQGWVYLHLEGGPYERGYQYGYLASSEIIDMIQRWSNLAHNFNFMKIYITKNYEELSEKWWDICQKTSMNTFIKHVPDEYQQEMKGMFDGVKAQNKKIFGRNIEYEDIVAIQFVQEVQYTNFKYFHKRFHPIRRLVNGLQDIITEKTTEQNEGHCNAFIATGDATSNGGIVAAHATIFNHYVAQRCNIIVDIQPTEGHRFIMTCPPGSLWSQEDYYQNEQGIILTETELVPQGPFILKGAPKGVRSRNAIQHSNCIDDVINNLKKQNNGLIPNEWLIGDTKTGEIAMFQQALYNTPIKRTFNGFFWSCTVPHDIKVLGEITGVPPIILKLISKIFPEKFVSKSSEELILKTDVVKKFIELEEKYYGKIDTETAKEILATNPINMDITDAKITDSKLMKNMGLFAFMGIPDGSTWTPTEEQEKMYHGITFLPPNGWVEIYPSNYKDYKINSLTTTSSYTVNKDAKYFGSWDGNIYAIDPDTKDVKWKYKTGWGVVTTPAVDDKMVFAGSLDNNFYALDKETGKLEWSFTCKSAIHSSPVVYGEYVFFGCDDGNLYALNKTNGKLAWSFAPEHTIENNDINNYITTPITSSPVVENGFVYIDVNDDTYRLDAQTEIAEENIETEQEHDCSIFVFILIFSIILFFVCLIIRLYINKKDGE